MIYNRNSNHFKRKCKLKNQQLKLNTHNIVREWKKRNNKLYSNMKKGLKKFKEKLKFKNKNLMISQNKWIKLL